MTSHHVTYIDGPDSAGHWEWHCSAPDCPESASGYELAVEVIAAAQAHGPLAADSLIPVDEDEQ
jgi:hypothetical protein